MGQVGEETPGPRNPDEDCDCARGRGGEYEADRDIHGLFGMVKMG